MGCSFFLYMPKIIEKRVIHPEFGEIRVRIGARSRGISLRILGDRTIVVSMPARCEISQATDFLNLKHEWVAKHLSRIDTSIAASVFSLPMRTRLYTVERIAAEKPMVKVLTGRALVGLPIDIATDSSTGQKAITAALKVVWREEAKSILPLRVERLAKEFGFKYGNLSVRDSRGRWGSCSSTDDLSLSLNLMMLPDHLIDYVLIHELCHTVHKNHGRDFHSLLDRCVGGQHKALRKELKEYRIR